MLIVILNVVYISNNLKVCVDFDLSFLIII